MSFPDHPTVELPADVGLGDLVLAAPLDPQGIRAELVDAVSGSAARRGHLCVVSWVLSPDFSQTLFIRHRRFGWMPAGGHMVAGESVSECAARELAEETGVTAVVDYRVVSVHGTMIPESADGPAHMHWAFGVALILDPSTPIAGEYADAARWFLIDDSLPESFFGDNWLVRGIAALLAASG